jgi:hypothetical protein
MTRTSLGRRTKSVEQSIEDTDEPGTRLRKDLTWWDLIVFGVSVVIGAGIFTITASTAGNITGPAISISSFSPRSPAGLRPWPQTLGAGAAGSREFGALIHRECRKARPIRG